MAACQLRKKNYTRTMDYCKQVLALDENNNKAKLRIAHVKLE